MVQQSSRYPAYEPHSSKPPLIILGRTTEGILMQQSQSRTTGDARCRPAKGRIYVKLPRVEMKARPL